ERCAIAGAVHVAIPTNHMGKLFFPEQMPLVAWQFVALSGCVPLDTHFFSMDVGSAIGTLDTTLITRPRSLPAIFQIVTYSPWIKSLHPANVSVWTSRITLALLFARCESRQASHRKIWPGEQSSIELT